jgi:hypothetical protein
MRNKILTTCALVLSIILINGCKSGTLKEVSNLANNTVNNDSIIASAFNNSLINLNKKYPNNYPFVEKIKGQQIDSVFVLRRRVYLPEFNGLTLDLRAYAPCAGCSVYRFLHIYSGGTFYLLPITDLEIYSNINDSLGTRSGKLNFIDELNGLISHFNYTTKEDIERLIQEIMKIREIEKVDKTYLPRMKIVFSEIESDPIYSDSCRKNLKNNYKIAENWVKERRLVYSNGLHVYMFVVTPEKSVLMSTLNLNCNSHILY